MNYLLSRHPGAIQWLTQRVPKPYTLITHINDVDCLIDGDCVMGTLPIEIIAKLSRNNISYWHLCIELPEQLRGIELSAAMLDELNAQLREFLVFEPLSDEAALNQGEMYKLREQE